MPDGAVTRGRPLHPSRAEAILAAAAELLGEIGYDAMSMDAIASRAGVSKATIYRRWAGKTALVLDTVRVTAYPPTQPSTGSLRGDLLSLMDDVRERLTTGQIDHLAGVLVALRSDADLAAAVKEQLVEAWVQVCAAVVEAAVARGEIARLDDAALELFCRVGPGLAMLRYLAFDGPIDKAFVADTVDHVLLPIVGAR